MRTRAVAVDRARGRAAQARQNGRAFRALTGFNRDKYWVNSQSLCARSTMVQCNSRPRASVVFFPWAHHRFIIHSRIVLDAFDSFDGHRSFSMHSIVDGHRSFSMHSIHSMVIGRSRCIRFDRWSSVVLDAFDSSMVIGRSRCIRFDSMVIGRSRCIRIRRSSVVLDAFDSMVIGRSRCIRCIRRSSVVLDAFDCDGHRSFSMHSIVVSFDVEANFPGARPCDRRSTFDALDAFDALARASARR